MTYWFLKHALLGPAFRLLYRPAAEGLGNVPARGGAILASNHVSFLDSLLIPLAVPRRVVFMGKSDYFERLRTRWFFRMAGVIPVRRDGSTAGETAVRAGITALECGEVLGIYPEGTRSPDGRLYRARTGVARMAIATGCPVIPVAVHGTRDVQPPGRRFPRLRGRMRIVIGRPLTFESYAGRERDRLAVRSVADEVMYEIMALSGQEYADEFAARAGSSARLSREEDVGGDRRHADAEVLGSGHR